MKRVSFNAALSTNNLSLNKALSIEIRTEQHLLVCGLLKKCLSPSVWTFICVCATLAEIGLRLFTALAIFKCREKREMLVEGFTTLTCNIIHMLPFPVCTIFMYMLYLNLKSVSLFPSPKCWVCLLGTNSSSCCSRVWV